MDPLPPPPPPTLTPPPKAFRPATRLLLAADVWGPPLAAGLLLGLGSRLAGHPLPWREVLALTGLVFVVTFAGGLVWVCLPSAYVGADGLRATGGWGGVSLVRWHEIASVERRSWLGLPLVRVRSSRGGFVQFPWPLADRDGFLAALREHGGPDCLVARWLDPGGA